MKSKTEKNTKIAPLIFVFELNKNTSFPVLIFIYKCFFFCRLFAFAAAEIKYKHAKRSTIYIRLEKNWKQHQEQQQIHGKLVALLAYLQTHVVLCSWWWLTIGVATIPPASEAFFQAHMNFSFHSHSSRMKPSFHSFIVSLFALSAFYF